MTQDQNIQKIPSMSAAKIMAELRAVTWPTKEQTWQLTMTVLVICLIVGAFVGIIDISLAKVLEILTNR